VTKTILISAGIGVAAIASVAIAQPGPPPEGRGRDTTRQEVIERTEARFDRLDENRDGRVTPEEARAARDRARSERAERMFDRLDANDDGSISRDEMREGQGRRGGGMRMGRRGGPEGPGGRMRGMRAFGEQGFITRDQMRERALARFDRLDGNRDGTVTMAERQAAREARRERRRMRMQDDS
jgi:Ca2+-binding EF-hand superfamily protein